MKNEANFFLKPIFDSHRQYEALRAYYVEGLSVEKISKRYGYTVNSFYVLLHRNRELKAEDFFIQKKGGRKKMEKGNPIRKRIIELRKKNYSVYDIQRMLVMEGKKISHVAIEGILKEEGFARLLRRKKEDKPFVDTVQPIQPQKASIHGCSYRNGRECKTDAGGVFLFIPYLVQLDLPGVVEKNGLPGSKMIPAINYILSIVGMKLLGKERYSHIMEYCFDEGLGLFAGLNVLPKKSAITDYSYRTSRDVHISIMQDIVKGLKEKIEIPGKSFNLDFHTIPYYGEKEEELEKNYVPRRGHAERSILTFIAQEGETNILCYTNAEVRKNEKNKEIIKFAKYWEEVKGEKPGCLVFDSQLTDYKTMRELEEMRIRFITLQKRGKKIISELGLLGKKSWKKINLEMPQRKYQTPSVFEEIITPKDYGEKLRRLAVTNFGHEEPTLIITNDFETSIRDLIVRYAHRTILENALSENIAFFHLDSLCSGVVLNADFSITWTLVANALYKLLAQKLKGFENAKAKTIFRNILNLKANIIIQNDDIIVQYERRRHNPTLIQAGYKDLSVKVPWWNNRSIHYTFR